MAAFEAVQEDRGAVRVVSLSGVVDARGATALGTVLAECVAAGRRALLLDLAAVESIAGEGLRTMATWAARLQADAGALALCRANRQVSRVLGIAGVDRTLAIHRDRAAACEWLETTVRRERIARMAARLLRSGGGSSRWAARRPFRAGAADTARAALAARLLAGEHREPPAQGPETPR